MIYLILFLILAIAVLVIGIIVSSKRAKAGEEKLKEAEKNLKSTRDELRRIVQYQAKREEVQNHAEETKETLHTGNTDNNFANSLGVLHGESRNGRNNNS